MHESVAPPLRVGSLFAGIGGFDLGFERAGMHTAWQVEVDPYCRAVLAQHFPEAERYEDVRDVGAHNLAPVDLICGGFPCQDLSGAGKGAGIDGARSGLWSEFARIIRELRPRYVVVENVPDLLVGRGKRWPVAPIGRVLGDLSESGYDAEWACLSAEEFGAPHLRERVWLVAYSDDPGCPQQRRTEPVQAQQSSVERGGAKSQRSQWAAEPNVDRVANGVPFGVDRVAALGNALVPQIAEWIGCALMCDHARRDSP